MFGQEVKKRSIVGHPLCTQLVARLSKEFDSAASLKEIQLNYIKLCVIKMHFGKLTEKKINSIEDTGKYLKLSRFMQAVSGTVSEN